MTYDIRASYNKIKNCRWLQSEFKKEVSCIVAYKDLTAAQKATRKAYAKTRRDKINAAARAAGVIGAPRPKMSAAEAKAKRKAYSKDYRKRIVAQARAYRAMMEKE